MIPARAFCLPMISFVHRTWAHCPRGSSWSNVWTVTGGMLQGGPNPNLQFLRLRFSHQHLVRLFRRGEHPVLHGQCRYGGGIGGRLDTNTGAHYAAWVYSRGFRRGAALGRPVAQVLGLETIGVMTARRSGPSRAPRFPASAPNWHDFETRFLKATKSPSTTMARSLSLLPTRTRRPARWFTSICAPSVEFFTDPADDVFSVSNYVVSIACRGRQLRRHRHQPAHRFRPGIPDQ